MLSLHAQHIVGLATFQDDEATVFKHLYHAGVGGLSLTFGKITITSIACALLLGILVNNLLKKDPNKLPERHDFDN